MRKVSGSIIAILVFACASPWACSKRDEAGKPSSVPPLDPGAAAQPPPAPAPAAPPAPPVAAAEPAAPAAPADPNASISGQIVLPAAMAKKKPSGTLYLVARRPSDNPTARGTLIAVKKMPATSFPLAFSLTGADMPFQNGPFEGDMTLTVRIDQDGDPMTRQKGDVHGALPKVRVGARNVKLALDQLQTEDESLAQPGGMGRPPMMGGEARPPGHP